MSYREIVITGSTLRNGRIYFSASDKGFFPADCFGERSAGSKGRSIEFVAAGETYTCDMRTSSGITLSPRSSFARFLKASRAVEGGRLRVTRLAERRYALEYRGGAMHTQPTSTASVGVMASFLTDAAVTSMVPTVRTDLPQAAHTDPVADAISAAATPVLRINGLKDPRWRRNVASGSRIGPWLQAEYAVLNSAAWQQKLPCLYVVIGHDRAIRYVGISRNGLSHRWRLSPALEAATMRRLPEKQLFHSQCWKHIEAEFSADPHAWFEVRVISGTALANLLERLSSPAAAFARLRDNPESVVAAVERWLCNRSSQSLARWNIAMTGAAN